MKDILARRKALIFDVDGTLVDSNELHVESWDRAFRHFGKSFSRDRYRSELFKKEYLPRVKPFPKVRELFEHLRRDGKRIVLASSGKKEEVEHYTKLLQIEDLIEGATTADDAESSKPAPDIFVAALKKLDGVSPDEAITVGDTRFDIEAARKAGLDCIALLCGGTDEEILRKAGAVAIFRDPADLLSAMG
jgi:HAD superfamily hydrolase (TIGR01549 family)